MAIAFDIIIDQGATFSLQLIHKDAGGVPISNVGKTARMKIRQDYRWPEALVSLTDVSGLALGGSNGVILITIDAATTATLPAGTYKYDLELIDAGGVVTRMVQGSATVSAEVTW